MINFQPLQVVGRGSETQLQVGEYLKNNLAGEGFELRSTSYRCYQ